VANRKLLKNQTDRAMKFPLMRNNILREDLDAVIEHLRQDDPILTHGDNVRAFEEEWSNWLGVKYSVFVNSGASANLLTMTTLKIRHPDGGEVIVPPLTWISDIASVLQNGFTPVFVDIDPQSLAMDTKQVLAKITDRTRAVFLTHVQGFDGLTDDLVSELKRKNIPLVEDVCESHGATHNGRRLGSFGWISNFSFYYAHHMSTIEGGMVCTNDHEVYQQVRMLRSHGMVREANDAAVRSAYQQANPELNPDFIFAFPAYNTRNTELGGIIGRSQLKRLDDNVRRRTENLHRFLRQIDPTKYKTDFKLEGSSNYAFNLVLQKPDKSFVQRLMAKMRESGIEFRRGSAGGGNQIRQPYLKGIVPENYHKQFPEVEHIHFYGFYIGNFPDLRDEEVNEICAILNSVE
jgi:CDP-6-deoxy-D-xylo-4-hexulose-3-dehydrase